MSNYALINPVNSVETVMNVIVADSETAETYEQEYDYVIDLTEVSPCPGPGWTYDPGEDVFTPPPIDYLSYFQSDLESIHGILMSALINAQQCEVLDAENAMEAAAIALDEEFADGEDVIYAAICAWLDSQLSE